MGRMGAPRLVRAPAAPAAVRAERDAAAVHAFHRSLPGYAPSPLRAAPAAAAALGVREVLVKDESARLGPPSFKILGASWATYRALCRRLGRDPAPLLGLAELGAAVRARGPLALVAATDGNHG